MHTELAEERGHVNLDRALGEVESARYLFVGSALYDQPQNIKLAAGQRVDGRRQCANYCFVLRKTWLLAGGETGLPFALRDVTRSFGHRLACWGRPYHA
jgi:hypothetical protein